jgi:hypothetical protein
MATTPRTKRDKSTAAQKLAKRSTSSVQRRVDALSDITLTEEEATFADEVLARPSRLPREYAPLHIPEADRSLLK